VGGLFDLPAELLVVLLEVPREQPILLVLSVLNLNLFVEAVRGQITHRVGFEDL
jgi:hypothetical protein